MYQSGFSLKLVLIVIAVLVLTGSFLLKDSILAGLSQISMPKQDQDLKSKPMEIGQPTTTPIPTQSLQSAQAWCQANNGTWLQQYNECEFIFNVSDEVIQSCTQMKGEFKSCESPCRHTDAEVCVSACAPVCKF